MTLSHRKTLHGRRQGRPFSPTQESHLEEGLRRFGIERGLLDWHTLFAEPKDKIFLEIGFGGGEHLAHQAARAPQNGYIGCEPFLNGVAKLCRLLMEGNLTNVRFYPDDVWHLLQSCPLNFLDGIYILFPDPWPKTRHHKRRLVSKDSLEKMAPFLKTGGQILLATDHAAYAAWMQEHIRAQNALRWVNEEETFQEPLHWVKTRYQEKAEQKGIPAQFMVLEKPS